MYAQREPLQLPSLSDLGALPTPPSDFSQVLGGQKIMVEPTSLVRLAQFVGLLGAARQLMNLTAFREPQDLWMKLILDALMLQQIVAVLPAGARVVDVGCGAGVPGLPLAIVAPEVHFTLVDATAKKVGFVRHVARELDLENVDAVVGRAEELTSAATASKEGGKLRECFDLVVARGVAPLPVLLEYTAPFAKAPGPRVSGGQLVLAKGEAADEELESARVAIQKLRLAHSGSLATPTGIQLRFDKLAATPVAYPRGNGVPKRRPL